MKYIRHNNSDTSVKLNVELDNEDLKRIKSKTLNRLKAKIEVPGFRPGKIPASVAEKHLDHNTLVAEIASDAVNVFLNDILKTEKLIPLDQPKVNLSKYVPGETMEFDADFEILPDIHLGDYKHLKVSAVITKVEEKEIDQIIERMRLGMASRKEASRQAKKGDETVIDFDGTKEGKQVPGASGKGYPLVIGSDSFIPGFEDSIIGKMKGDEFSVPLKFPEDYSVKSLAGEVVDFKVTVQKVNALDLPELNDEFAKKSGPYKNLIELREDIRKDALARKEQENLDLIKQDLIEQLIKNSEIPTPEILISDQTSNQEQDFINNLKYQGISLEEYLEEKKLSREEWVNQELREQAIKNVKISLALAELRRIEKVTLTAEELDERWNSLLKMYGNDPKIQQEFNNPAVRRDFANRLATEKAIDLLVELNK